MHQHWFNQTRWAPRFLSAQTAATIYTSTLSCAPTKGNLPKLKQYILNRYLSSAFNRCKMQPLPLMDGSPPHCLFVDEEARPIAIHTPAAVLAHWAAQVQAGLERDVCFGVLKCVPVNTLMQWCSRMLITSKSDCSSRSVVDFQPVNAYCQRQTYHTKSPWQIASSIRGEQTAVISAKSHGFTKRLRGYQSLVLTSAVKSLVLTLAFLTNQY